MSGVLTITPGHLRPIRESPSGMGGTNLVTPTVWTQKIADIWTALAFGFKNAMLSDCVEPGLGTSDLVAHLDRAV